MTATTPPRSAAALAVVRFQRGEISINELLPLCRASLRKVAYYTADKFQRRDIAGHREELANDLFQELQFFLWQEIATEYEIGRAHLESLLVKYAQNIVMNHYQDKEAVLMIRSGASVNSDFFDRGGNAIEDPFLTDVEDGFDIEAAADQEIALQQIAAIVAAHGGPRSEGEKLDVVLQSMPAARPVLPIGPELRESKAVSEMPHNTTRVEEESTSNSERRQRGGKHVGGPQYTLTPEQEELREIMKELRLKQPEFANALGIPQPRFSSYIYGRTDSVPPEVMANARGMRESGSMSAEKAKTEFDGRSMQSIMDAWQKVLGWSHDPIEERDQQLAKFLSVANVTPRRWRSGKNRPDYATLVRYQFLIDDFLHRRKEA